MKIRGFDKYGYYEEGVVPLHTLFDMQNPSAEFDADNPGVQRTDEERLNRANSIAQAMLRADPTKVFFPEPVQAAVDIREAPRGFKNASLEENVIKLGPQKGGADGNTRVFGGKIACKIDPRFLNMPVKVCVHYLHDKFDFMRLFLDCNLERNRLPAQLLAWLPSQGYYSALRQGLTPTRQETNAYATVKLCTSVDALYGRVQFPKGAGYAEPLGPQIAFKGLAGALWAAQRASKFYLGDQHRAYHEPLARAPFNALVQITGNEVFGAEEHQFADWGRLGLGAFLRITLAPLFEAAKHLTKNGQQVDEVQLTKRLVKDFGDIVLAEFERPECQIKYSKCSGDANTGPWVAQRIEEARARVLKLGLALY